MKEINKKDNRIEIIRIISIFLVIILHVTNRFLLNSFNANKIILIFINSITRISVPLFFMISGIVNIPKKFDKIKYLKRIFRMIIILIIWTLVYYFINNYKITSLIHAIFSYLKPHLWYMYALIGLYIVTPFISKMLDNLDNYEEKLFTKLWLIFSGIYYILKVILELFNIDTTITHPIPIFNATYYLGYYITGYLIYKNKENIKYNKILLCIIAISCIIINGILTSIISMNNNSYYQGFFGYSNILIIMPSIILLYLFLDKIKDKDYKSIKYICPYIFGIYLIHILILDKLIKYLSISNTIIGCIIYTILSFIISYIIIFIIKKTPYINKYIC